MKKTSKQIAAIVALIAICALIIAFVIVAFTAGPDSRNVFFALFFSIIALPILAWLMILSIGRIKGKHTMAEFFPENSKAEDSTSDTTEEK